MTHSDLQAKVLEVLMGHKTDYMVLAPEGCFRVYRCTCGEVCLPEVGEKRLDAHLRHVAGVIAQWVGENKGVKDGR
jgi:hypothetical protein